MPPDAITVHGRLVSGDLKLPAQQRSWMVETYRAWPEGADVSVTITRERPTLSKLQQGYWFAVVVPVVAEYTGDDVDSVHDDLLDEFGEKVTKRWVNAKTGRRRQRTRRVSLMELTTREMTDLIDRVRRDFGEQGVEIPEPDPEWRRFRRRVA